MTTSVGALTLRNPVMTASGTAGQGAELAPYMDLAALGAVVVKSLSIEPWAGNASPRLTPVAAGMLNSVGLQNPGIERWLIDGLPALAATGASVVVSVWGTSSDDFGRVAGRLGRALHDRSQTGAAAVVAIEANISCPNVEDRSRVFAHAETSTVAAVEAVARGVEGAVPIWVKLSPNVTDLASIAAAAIGAGGDGLTLTNTLMGLAIDPVTGRARLGNGGGGLSGAALHPVAVRAVFDCRAALPDSPIVGVGGVSTGIDAAELLAAGANAVQVGTASFADPRAPQRVLDELEMWCRDHGVAKVTDLIGRAHG